MRIESGKPEIVSALRDMAEAVSINNGSVAPDFTIREQGGQFAAFVPSHLRGQVVVSYPMELRPPMEKVIWDENPNHLVIAGQTATLPQAQQRIVDAWVSLINGTDKLTHIRRQVPRYAVEHWNLRHHLANAGYPALRKPPDSTSLKNAAIAWHSAGAQPSEVAPDEVDQPRWRLIPLKCFVNHHPAGARQDPVAGRVAVQAETPTQTNETFENYGDLDAMQLLMHFGYLDDTAPLVHSVPTEVETSNLGRVVVRWRAPRNVRDGLAARNVPQLRPTEDGLELHHLTARPGNRAHVATFLAMATQSRAGLPEAAAKVEAEKVLDAIADSNLSYYRRLDKLLVEANSKPAARIASGFGNQAILPTIAAMSLLQQQRWHQMWG